MIRYGYILFFYATVDMLVIFFKRHRFHNISLPITVGSENDL